MTQIVEKVKQSPVSSTLHGLSAAAIVWMFATFGTKSNQESLMDRTQKLEIQVPVLQEQMKTQKEWVLYFLRGMSPAEFEQEQASYE